MKKNIAIVLGIIMALSLVACAKNAPATDYQQKQKDGQILEENSAQIPNPFVDCETIADAEKIAGFEITVPDKMPEGYSQSSIQAINDYLIQIFYESGDNEILIRKGIGSEDISGDYNTYSESNTMTIGELTINTKGNDGKINVATWINGEYTFSILVNPGKVGVDNTVINDMVVSIQ